MDAGIEVIVVTSGAIGSGLGLLGLERRGLSLSELQAIASIGQNHLMDIYNGFLNKRGYRAGQILLTQEDLNDRKRFLNIRYTLNTLFQYKAIPVINENDSVSTEEIKCGDNDRLSGMVADLAASDMLIILSDVDGLLDLEGNVVNEVSGVDGDIAKLCKGKGCEESTGGMATKLDSIKNAARAGVVCFIANGREKNILERIVRSQDVGTRFMPSAKPLNARKRWIAYTKKPKGKVIVDKGAEKALTGGKRSLLPGGVLSAEGVFAQGDVVDIVNETGRVFAKGLSNYSTAELLRIKGKRSAQIEELLGYKDYDEVVHRDNMVMI